MNHFQNIKDVMNRIIQTGTCSGMMNSGIFCKSFIVLLFLFVNLTAIYSQDSSLVKGLILSHLGEPVKNVSVSMEGSDKLPVLTNEKGEFQLVSYSPEDWMLISPTSNYKVKRVYLNKRNSVKIYLTPTDLSSGDDEFIVLEQLLKRRNLAASVSEMEMKNFQKNGSISVDQLLQGRVAGMYVVNRSGMPGSGAVTTIRGLNSLYANNQPLYVVDGIPIVSQGVFNSNLDGYDYNALVNLNPFDISEFNIVKDPSLTALYGSKASNGVIFIQTLKPTATQTTIELDYRNGFSLSPSNLIPQLNGVQHKTLVSELLVSSGIYEEDLIEEYPVLFLEEEDLNYLDYQHNTNWQELIFSNALMTNINLNVKGGDEIARYGLSFGYTDSDGIIKTTNYTGYNLRFVSLLNIFTWLKMDAGVSFNYNSSNLKEAATVTQTSPIFTALAKSPLINPYQYDLARNVLTDLTEIDELGVSNPLATIDNYSASNSNYNFVARFGLDGKFSDKLQLKSKFNLTYNILKERIFMPNRGMELYYDNEAINVAKASNNDITSFFNNTYLTFSQNFGGKHLFTSNTGFNIQSNKYQFDWGLTKNAHENDEYRMIQDGQNDQREIGGLNRNWNWISLYEFVTYSLMDRYLFSGSVSLDGSSRIGDNATNTIRIDSLPFGLFYSAGAAWRLSQESFLKNLSWLEELKLRVAIGKSGNDDIGEASATNYYQAIKFRETVGLFPATVPNDQLTYETVLQINAGLDLGLFGNRFRASLDLFQTTTENMLIFSPLDPYFGYDLRMENGGEMKNTGWEFNTFLRILDLGSFKWDLQANLSSFTNTVTSLKGDQLAYTIPGGEKINMVGAAANSFYGLEYLGVYSTQSEALADGFVNDKGLPFQAGDAKFADISGPAGSPDKVIDAYDRTIIGSSHPELFGGLNNTFYYKRFSLSTMLQFVKGNEVFNYVRYLNESMSSLYNQSTTVLNRWQYEGQTTTIPKAYWQDPMGNSAFSSRWIEDGSYLRLKNVTISYRIPDKFLAFRNAEFYISANNILTFSDYLGYDPEFAFSHSQVHQGVDYGQTPQVRQFLAGIKLGF